MKLSLVAFSFLIASAAHARPSYNLTITNTTSMPIAAGVVYLSVGQDGASEVGQTPTPGLTALCQMGNPAIKLSELNANPQVRYAAQTPGQIQPGQSITVAVPFPRSPYESLHFEAMYGKSKEACASISIPAKAFLTVQTSGEVKGRDDVIVAGSNTQPAVPATGSDHVCDGAAGAVDCLRNLSSSQTGGQIGFFPGYLPTVLSFLEAHYGAADVQTLLIPPGGGVRYSLKGQ